MVAAVAAAATIAPKKRKTNPSISDESLINPRQFKPWVFPSCSKYITSFLWGNNTRKITDILSKWIEPLFLVCGAATQKIEIHSLSVRIKCEYPQKLSTDVDKPVDNTVLQVMRKDKSGNGQQEKPGEIYEQVFAVYEAFVYTVIKTNECLQRIERNPIHPKTGLNICDILEYRSF